jgi:ATP-binding cassette, subfamily B (MDR/TAP), member 1
MITDKQSVGKITSQLQDDAARIHAFSGEPVRAFLTAVASVVTGVALGFYVRAPSFEAMFFFFFVVDLQAVFLLLSLWQYMWEFALLSLGCIPLMAVATSLEMSKMLGTDEGKQLLFEHAGWYI